MHIALLGRQPALGIAELERVFGPNAVDIFTPDAVTVATDTLDVTRLGGATKVGVVIAELRGDWRQVSQKVISHYQQQWSDREGKITLGISAYGFPITSRDVQKTGIILKQKLKQSNVSLRLIPNQEIALSTATSHHNKLGLSDNKVELLVIRGKGGKVIVAESTGSQNITAYAKRDQGRPKRDAFVGMLPPKLAQIMINLAYESSVATKSSPTLLDPFCGTGVLLQEAALLGYNVYGTDLSDKMIDYSGVNLDWLKQTHHTDFASILHQGDAMTTLWQQPVDVVAGETYLGQPFSAPPSPSKLREVRGNCDHIISTFLRNLAPQLSSGTPLCLAIPAWKDTAGHFTHLPLTSKLEEFGFETVQFKNTTSSDLLYHREDQVVGRELLVIRKK